MKIAYVYSGARKEKLTGTIHRDYPDTPFYGANYLAEMPDTSLRYIETADFVRSAALRKILGFRFSHLLTYFFTFQYDVVIGSSLFYALILRRVFPTKARYVLLNFSITRLLETKKGRIAKWFTRSVLEGADAIVCLSDVQRRYLVQMLPAYAGRIALVPLGVDDQYYTATYEGRDETILSIGRDNGRDYATLIDAARLLPSRTFHLVCSKRNLTGIADIPSNVTIDYDLPIQSLRALYQKAHLLLLTTHDDSFGEGSDCSGQTVLLEAMATGLPIVASRKAYIHEYVRDGEEALLVDFYDAQDIVKKIELLDDPQHAVRLARAARVRVEKEFSTRMMAERLYRLVTQLIPAPK